MKDEEFERLLKISRLSLTDAERKRIKADIEEVLGYFDRIGSIRTNEKPAYQPIHVPTRLRKDEVVPFRETELLKRQSKLNNGYIVGPKL